ncbi:aminotransferase class V-fold PLP-dependent enzyme [Massilia sp. DWR3-1-1]|uniref:aminotransferase class V-fold PLP-dependent enzyme n=1 Tax=Massilia sp. DWR3-1-1 TaxID=2804559 RepID=UPI003CEAA0CE
MTNEVYLDANATSPALPLAIAAAVDAMQERFGNPSSSHAAGLRARAMLGEARAAARRVIGAGQGELVFTSGATEAIQTAVLSALCDLRQRQLAGEAVGDLLLYGATEHKAIPECLAHWNRILGTGCVVQALAVDADGRHRLDLLQEMAPRAALVCTMAANNETGVVAELAAIEAVLAAHAPRALWLVDCVQALGKLPLALATTAIDYAVFSGHKLYAPKGIGMLYVRQHAPFTPLMMGGGQESGLRSGTENMAGIAALGAVLGAFERGELFRRPDQLALLRERLAAALTASFPGLVFNAPFAHSLPTTLNFSVPGVTSDTLLKLFDAAGVRVSAGSACSAAAASASHVLTAMGVAGARAGSAVRLSFSPTATDAFIDGACARIARCGAALARHGAPADSVTPSASAVVADGADHVDGAELAAFLARHPQARLVDVREACEHAAAAAGPWHGRAIDSVPLSALPAQLDALLAQPARPLLLFCRSGQRSLKALHLLRAAGHQNVYHLAGGVALAPQ